MKTSQEDLKELAKIGFWQFREIEGLGLCALQCMTFTVGLMVGIKNCDYELYQYRYCYSNEILAEAVIALATWDGKGDPSGRWVKRKGFGGERSNENGVSNFDDILPEHIELIEQATQKRLQVMNEFLSAFDKK